MVRQIAREVGRQLDSGTDPERLRHRLELRYARVMADEIRDVGRWLLGVALPHWGCGHQDCETGLMWTTGQACDVCAEVCADRAAQRETERRQRLNLCPQHGTRPRPDGSCVDCDLEHTILHPAPVPSPREGADDRPVGNCHRCRTPLFLLGQAVVDGLCLPCREQPEQYVAARVSEAFVQCAGAPGEPCTREALPTRTVCLRHRSQELAAEAAAALSGGPTA